MDAVKPRILIVNDDPTQLGLMAKVIEQDGAEVSTFYSAEEALAHIMRGSKVDLVVTDLRMPGIDGWRFCRLLRSPEFPQTRETPILVVSATFSKQDIGSVVPDGGTDAFLAMPYTVQELRDTVRELLHRRPSEPQPSALIVDLATIERQQIAEEFAFHGYRVLEAEDGRQARVFFELRRPDVVVLSHRPPRIDALDMLPVLRSAESNAVVMVITAEHSAELAVAFTRQGADVYIHKPFDTARLISLAVRAKQEKAMLHVEDALETWAQEALLNAKRIQRLNDSFLSLGTDHQANIEELTRTAGDLVDAPCAFFRTQSPSMMGSSAEVGTLFAYSDSLSPRVIRHVQETAYADAAPCVREYGLQTYVECPVIVQGRIVGSLCVGWIEDREPATEDLDMLQILARAIGQQAQLRRRDQELVALNEVGRVVTSALTLDEMLMLLRSKARDVIGTEACSIALIDPPSGELVFRQADDPLADRVVGQRLKLGQGIAGQVAQTGQSVLIPDAQSDPRFYDGIDTLTGISTRDIICAPLIVQDKAIGVIELLNKLNGRFTEDDVRLLESIAAQTASAIENARLHELTQRELSERIRAERALRESTRRLQTLIDAAPDLVYLKDRELRYLLVNQAFAGFWSIDPNEIVGKTDADFMPVELAQTNHQSDQQALEERQVIILEQQDGERVTETRKAAVIDDEGQAAGIAGIIRDITDRKRLEERLIQEQKEESVLTLAGGIAHDFNNALVGIVGNIDLLRMEVPSNPEIVKTLRAMERSAQRMVNLTEQLLAYAGGVKHEPQPVDLNTVLDETLEMMQTQLDSGITVQREQAKGLWEIEANSAQIKQVLVNVITNACESMTEGGGTLSLRTENVRRRAWICSRHRQHPAGEYVHLAVTDTGPGMDEQVQKRLFEPFFSTKFMGRGLGLAVAMGIARDHRGCIEIDSQPQYGTSVHLYLPRMG